MKKIVIKENSTGRFDITFNGELRRRDIKWIMTRLLKIFNKDVRLRSRTRKARHLVNQAYLNKDKNNGEVKNVTT